MKFNEVADLDPAMFRIPASDTQGHSERIQCRIQPAIMGRISSLVQSRKFPYRTKGDLMRHAISKHIDWLEVTGSVPSVTAEVDAMMEVLRDEEFSADFQAVFEKVGERVVAYLGCGSESEARRLLLSICRHIDRMPDGYWRTRYRKEIDNRWGHIMRGGKRASLKTTEFETE